MATPTTNIANRDQAGQLKRDVGFLGATMMGLGSILGTGVFVSIGIAAGAAGPAVVLSIAVAALVATANGLSSAQLAANHPVSGGTYEYGYRWLNPSLGFSAGWMFVCAKSASAATAALGCAGYFLNAVDQSQTSWLTLLGLAVVIVLTLLVLSGIQRSNTANIAIVSVTLVALAVFILTGLPMALHSGMENLTPFFAPVHAGTSAAQGILEASALMFVAYTGYGRIATLAEEVRAPERSIPLAIIATLFVSMALYILIGLIGVASVGAETFAGSGVVQAAPLEIVAQQFSYPAAAKVIAVGAIAAMLGVLLNLILGLSRVVLAMARRGDAPHVLSVVGSATATPYPAVILVACIISGLVMVGDVKTTWSFSAFTVLIYYAITNLAAIRLSKDERLYSPVFPWIGLFSCLFLAFWVEPRIWMLGLALIAVGLVWHNVARRLLPS